MSTREHEPISGDERTCEAAGTLAARATLEPDTSPDEAQWVRLQDALQGRRRRAPWRLVVIAAPVAAGALLLCVFGGRHAAPRPGYVVQGAVVASDGSLQAAADVETKVSFDDGSSIALDGGSRARLTARPNGGGAELAIHEGRVRLAVLQHPRARWAAIAGPFRAETGAARFDVRWSTVSRHIEAYVWQGEVKVSGGPAGGGVVLQAGDRLTADSDGKLSVSRATDRPQRQPAAAPTVPAKRSKTPRSIGTAKAGTASRRLASAQSTVAPAPTPAAELAVERPAIEITQLSEIDAGRSEEPPVQFLAQGGSLCRGVPSYSFDETMPPVASFNAVGYASIDHERSWCGSGSMSAALSFSLTGKRNARNQILTQQGELRIQLPEFIDLTNRTVTVRVYVEAASEVRYGAAIVAYNVQTPVDGGRITNVAPGRWVTLRHTFAAQNQTWAGPISPVDKVRQIAVSLWVDMSLRVWTGRVYVDELEIR